MPTRVYFNGKSVIVDQVGETTLTIPQRLSSYVLLQPSASNDGLTIPDAENVTFLNFANQDSRTELISEVQDQAGAGFTDFLALQAYLSFIPNQSSQLIQKEGASTENQEIIITQNEVVKENTEKTVSELKVLDSIKEDSATNNKLLGKIYNQE